jgi:hypothetical protein
MKINQEKRPIGKFFFRPSTLKDAFGFKAAQLRGGSCARTFLPNTAAIPESSSRPIIVPRFQLGHLVAPDLKDAYYARIHIEHSNIVEAIERQHGRAARQAMRKHLHNSLERVRALALASGAKTTDAEQKAAAASLFAEVKRPLRVNR